jgi:hypothetical protein
VTLRLTTRPPGAVVRNRDGAVVGKTPLALSLKPGSTQRLTFSKAGYAPVTRKVTVPDENDAVSIELSKLAARRPHRR